MLYYGLMEVVIVIPLAIVFLRNPPRRRTWEDPADERSRAPAVTGWPPNLSMC